MFSDKILCLDCESLESTVSSLAARYQASPAEIRNFIVQTSVEGDLYQSFEGQFGPVKGEWGSVCWFHLTRVPAGTDFSEGILPLYMSLDKIWVAMAHVVNPIEKVNLEKLRGTGVSDRYVLKTAHPDCFAGPYAMLVKGSAFQPHTMGNYDYLSMPEIIQDICDGYEEQFGKSVHREIADGFEKCIVKFEIPAGAGEDPLNALLSYCWCKYHNEDLRHGATATHDNCGKLIPHSAIRKIEFL